MKIKNIALILLITGFLILVLLVSCKMELGTRIYIADLSDLINSEEENFYIKAIIEFEILSEDKFNETLVFLKKYFKKVENPKIVDRNFDTFLNAEIELPIVKSQKYEFSPTNDLLNITLEATNENTMELGLYINKTLFHEIKEYISEEYWQTIDIEDMTIYLFINNDLRQKVSVDLHHVYVNNKAVLGQKDIKLARRDEINIKISDLLRDYIYENGFAYFINIKLLEEKSNL